MNEDVGKDVLAYAQLCVVEENRPKKLRKGRSKKVSVKNGENFLFGARISCDLK